MNEAELRQLLESDIAQTFPEWTNFQVSSASGRLVVNGKVAFPVEKLDCSIDQKEDAEILDETGTSLGVLCFCRKLGEVEIARLTDWQLVAYLNDVSPAEFNQSYHFRKDYAVIETPFLQRYESEFLRSAPLWGGFWHEHPTGEPPTYLRDTGPITAIAGITIPTLHHSVALRRATFAADPLDRYLKLYHEIELLFDWVVVRKIQNLSTDLVGVGRILSGYAANDLTRLKSIVGSYTGDPGKLASRLMSVTSYLPTAEQIFQVYGKEGNPLKEPVKWSSFLDLLRTGSIDDSHAKRLGLPTSDKLHDLIRDVASYWIFRIRCCIAHNRIGEYIIGYDQEEFVVEFGERLLRESLTQILQHQDISTFAGP